MSIPKQYVLADNQTFDCAFKTLDTVYSLLFLVFALITITKTINNLKFSIKII